MKRQILLILLLTSMTPGINFRADMLESDQRYFSISEKSCTDNETWSFGSEIPKENQESFRRSIHSKTTPMTGFAEALHFRNNADSREAKFLGEYWISRILYETHLFQASQNALSVLVSYPLNYDTVGIQFAALECLLKLRNLHPTIPLNSFVLKHVPQYAKFATHSSQKEIYWDALDVILREQLANPSTPKNELLDTVDLLRGSGSHESLALTLVGSKEGQFDLVIEEGNRFLKDQSLPYNLKKFTNTVHLLVARAYYSTQQYELASSEYKTLDQDAEGNSNLELAWSYLMSERYGEAIGTAINLQAGILRHRFFPEAPMIMAMALNELCQYFESIKATHFLQETYETSYQWLKNWEKDEKKLSNSNLYQLAIDFHHGQLHIPEKIFGEWIHSPAFLANQNEITLLQNEIKKIAHLNKEISYEKFTLGNSILRLVRGHKNHSFSNSQLAQVVKKLNLFHKIQHSSSDWQTVLNQAQKNSHQLQTKLISDINRDLKNRNHAMLSKLDEIIENTRQIEEEIYTGARQEGVLKASHPVPNPNSKMAKRTLITPSEGTPFNIWKSELMSFRANISDNCSSKDKYLALKKKHL